MRRGTDRAAQRRSRRRGLEVSSPRGDEGVTLIELLVAIVVILIILIPTAIFIVQAQKAVSAEHLRAEAINVATRQLETLQLEAAQGTLPTGSSTVTYPVAEAGSRVTKFKVKTSWTVITQGTNQSLCASNADVAQQIWFVTAVVTWPKMDGNSPVVQTTEIAPAQAGAVQQFAGEVAVRLTVDGTNPFLADPVHATITAHWQGSGADPAAPSGTFKTELESTASTSTTVSDGCIVFQDIDAYSDANGTYNYTISFAGNTGPPSLAAGGEQADINPPGGALTVAIPPLTPGIPHPVTVTMNTGTPLTVGYYNGSGSCKTAPGSALSPPLPSNGVPLSVGNSFLAPNNPAVFFGSAPIPSLLLFPWSGVTSLWTGDQAYSASAGSCPVNATGGNPSVYLPVYPLNIKVTGPASTLTAKEVAGGGYAMTLNFNSGSGKWETSMPLGEYGLYHDGSATLNVSPNYVWVTAAGVCTDTNIEVPSPPSLVPSPPSPCSAPSVTVTAS
jgi:type II secretory pathway pseudopilin PulG